MALDLSVKIAKQTKEDLGDAKIDLQRIDLLDVEAAEAVQEALQGQLHAIAQRLDQLILRILHGGQRPLEIVNHAQQIRGKTLLAVLVSLFNINLRTSAQVLHLRLYAQHFSFLRLQGGLGYLQLFPDMRQGRYAPTRRGLLDELELAHLLDQHFQLDRRTGEIDRGGFVRAAADLLSEKVSQGGEEARLASEALQRLYIEHMKLQAERR